MQIIKMTITNTIEPEKNLQRKQNSKRKPSFGFSVKSHADDAPENTVKDHIG